jgi:hypothetical protein
MLARRWLLVHTDASHARYLVLWYMGAGAAGILLLA